MPRYAVANRQPSPAATAKLTSSGSGTTLKSANGSATYSANDPGPLKPGCHWWGQTCEAPDRHTAQSPHPQTNGTVTR